MSYFDYVYKRLFKTRGYSTSIFVNEVIKRSQSFLKSFNTWKASELCQEYLNQIWQSYFWKKQGLDNNPQVLLLETKHSNGFAINYEEGWNKKYFHYLFDYLADRVKKLDYRLVISKQIMEERGDNIETREMHYLKPKNDFNLPMDQKYGNVQIEYLSVNDEPTRIKLIANTYTDRAYKEAASFESLTEHIFSTES